MDTKKKDIIIGPSPAGLTATYTEPEYHEEKVITTIFSEKSRIDFPLKDFIWQQSWNRRLLWIAGIAILLQLIVFKYLYPHAGFIDKDSYGYLEAAYLNLNVGFYPIGYSKFLRMLSSFTRSDTILVALQYLLLQYSALYFFYTLLYFYKPGKLVTILLFICLVGNPVFLYISNYVLSDALFISLSLLWFTTLLWILCQPTPRLVAIHVLLLLLAFSVRYNALFYPLITVLALIISRQRISVKIISIGASILLITGFIYHTSSQYGKLTGGPRQFSPFSGWQLANNAIYAYREVQQKKSKLMPVRFRSLDSTLLVHLNPPPGTEGDVAEMFPAGTWYMSNRQSPLQLYMQNQFKKDTTISQLSQWASVGPLYAAYGTYLLKQYPIEFAKHYLKHNAKKFYAPPLEYLDSYNMGQDTVAIIAQHWFGYKDKRVSSSFKDKKVTVLKFYPITAAVLNVLFVLGLISFAVLKGFKDRSLFSITVLLAAVFWLVNFGFSVFAAPSALRFQLFPLLISFGFGLLLLEYVWKAATTEVK